MTDTLYSTAQAADALGISIARVRQLAAQHGLGSLVGNSLVFTESDIARMRHRADRRTKEARS